jgi:hypothetical protein
VLRHKRRRSQRLRDPRWQCLAAYVVITSEELRLNPVSLMDLIRAKANQTAQILCQEAVRRKERWRI